MIISLIVCTCLAPTCSFSKKQLGGGFMARGIPRPVAGQENAPHLRLDALEDAQFLAVRVVGAHGQVLEDAALRCAGRGHVAHAGPISFVLRFVLLTTATSENRTVAREPFSLCPCNI